MEIDDPPKPPWKGGSKIGIYVGLESFATMSNGEKIDNPRFIRSEEKALAKVRDGYPNVRRELLRGGKPLKSSNGFMSGSPIEDRYDFAHQISNQLVSKYGLIAFEDLNVTNMLKNHNLARNVSDAAWRMLVTTTPIKLRAPVRRWF